MGFWSKTFTWWNGATWGTALWTRRFGTEVGRDDAGNIYYQDEKRPARRWVIYNGSNDGSRVPPDWQLWLSGHDRRAAGKALPPVRKFQTKPTANLTGTMEAFRPDGALGAADPARLDRRLRALDPRISVSKVAAPLLIAFALAACGRGAQQQNASLPRGARLPRPPSGAGRGDADGAARRGARHPQQA